MEACHFSELIPGFPDELSLECLSRLPHTSQRGASAVCRRWRHLLRSRDFYHLRRKLGHTRKLACLVQALPSQLPPGGRKPVGPPAYAITVFDPEAGTWDLLDPVPDYPDGLPLFCRLASCDGELVALGGWHPARYEPVADVFVYDFAARRWRRGASMPRTTSFFAVGAHGGRVYVAGGHDEGKNALRSAWAYDVGRDEWAELAPMSRGRDECEGMVAAGGRCFWVVSGYGTEDQGGFDGSAEVYEFGTGEWRRAEGVWEPGRCPSSCAAVGGDGRAFNWADSDAAVRAGTCRVDLGGGGGRTLVVGSEYEGAPQGFYVAQGQNGKLEKIDVPEKFSGFARTGCCVEV
ncbi:F-box/kelch-repeat protein At2g44130-like [Syzygium oleosum]|uniref:F-box/kelch-repeat protein At2g44130-like n=1 Tax=Syzygium oleosum TaxID=219896 RepID=UPI0024BAF42C|nr:F-box/kelch-repeat protein At2g44130-like [Syzygium oleosum]